MFDVILFGSLGAFVAQENDASRAATPYLLAGIMLFHVLFQSQIARRHRVHGGDVDAATSST